MWRNRATRPAPGDLDEALTGLLAVVRRARAAAEVQAGARKDPAVRAPASVRAGVVQGVRPENPS
jgi:hypothetical protein